MREHEKIYTPSTQLNKICILGNIIWEKTHLEGEAYALLSFLHLWKESPKKEALTMEFPLTLCPERMLQNILPPLILSQNTTPWMLCSTMEQVQ
jgi:hypothetical protein